MTRKKKDSKIYTSVLIITALYAAFLCTSDYIMVILLGRGMQFGLGNMVNTSVLLVKLLLAALNVTLLGLKLWIWLTAAAIIVIAAIAWVNSGLYARIYECSFSDEFGDGFGRMANANFKRSLPITVVVAALLALFYIMAFIALIPAMAMSGAFAEGNKLCVESVTAIILVVAVAVILLLMWSLVRLYLYQLYRSMIFYDDKFISHTVSAIKTDFKLKYVRIFLFSFIYIAVKLFILYLCGIKGTTVAGTGMEAVIYVCNYVFKYIYVFLFIRKNV